MNGTYLKGHDITILKPQTEGKLRVRIVSTTETYCIKLKHFHKRVYISRRLLLMDGPNNSRYVVLKTFYGSCNGLGNASSYTQSEGEGGKEEVDGKVNPLSVYRHS